MTQLRISFPWAITFIWIALSALGGCELVTSRAESPAQQSGTAHFESAKIEWPDTDEVSAPPFELLMSIQLDKQDRAAAKIEVAIEREKGALAVALTPYHGEDDRSGRFQGRALIDSLGSQVLSIREGAHEVEHRRFTVARGLGLGGSEHVYLLHEEGANVHRRLTLHRWKGCDRDAAWITEWIGPKGGKPIVVQGRDTDLRDMLAAIESATYPAALLGQPERGARGPSLWRFGQEYAFPGKGVNWNDSPGTWEVHVYREGSPPFAGRFEVKSDGDGAKAHGRVTPIDITAPSDIAARLARIPQLAPRERDAFSTPLAATPEELRAMVRSRDVVLARIAMTKIVFAHHAGSTISLGRDADNMSPEERHRAYNRARDESSAEGAAAQLADVAKARTLVPALEKKIDALGKPDWTSSERPF